ncbi:TIGR03089 family protein [Ruania albidiflava]|uniref:TIGR03089 family protein n=1 Tax=Ruania albidiflava TaxID=366586 RepID=UPI0003B5A85C|nr:TIGR03089 family protein [Ruania albidiflava]
MTTATPPVLTVLDTWTHGQSAPALTWYGPDDERVELSGPVLANWVTKATNLLTDEADVTTETVVRLDLPMHWRTAVWALAVWACGGTVAFPGGEAADVLVGTTPDVGAAPLVIAVALPALARAVPDLPEGAIDGAAELMAQPDVLVNPPDWDPAACALAETSHGDLSDPARLVTLLPPPGRYLLTAGDPATGLRTALALWLTGGSVVLVGDPAADLDRIGAQEGAQPLPG